MAKSIWPKVDSDGIRYWEKVAGAAILGEYGVDWEDWLASAAPGNVIGTSEWTVPSGLTDGGDAHDDTKAKVRVSGGTAGTSYELVNKVTTTPGGQVESRTIRIYVVAKRGE